MGVLKKRYVSSYTDEHEAARVYDINAILTQGLKVRFQPRHKVKAKTNFIYSKRAIRDILNNEELDVENC